MTFPTFKGVGGEMGWEGRLEKVYRARCSRDTPVPVTVLCYTYDAPGSRWFLLVRGKQKQMAPGETWRVRWQRGPAVPLLYLTSKCK